MTNLLLYAKIVSPESLALVSTLVLVSDKRRIQVKHENTVKVENIVKFIPNRVRFSIDWKQVVSRVRKTVSAFEAGTFTEEFSAPGPSDRDYLCEILNPWST
jgi:hypothetical protein